MFYLQDKWLDDQGIIKDHGYRWCGSYRAYYQISDKAFTFYYRGRNYDLFNRFDKAIENYNKVILEFPNTFWAMESRWQISKIFYLQGRINESRNLLFELKSIKNIRYDHYKIEFMSNLLNEPKI